jgi:hypothetical protein
MSSRSLQPSFRAQNLAGLPEDLLRADCERTGAHGAANATEGHGFRFFHLGEGSFRCVLHRGLSRELRASARLTFGYKSDVNVSLQRL